MLNRIAAPIYVFALAMVITFLADPNDGNIPEPPPKIIIISERIVFKL